MFMAKAVIPTAWVGWVYFAASMLVLIGVMQMVQGLGAIFNPTYFVATSEHLIVFNIATWGWIHIGLGVVALAAGVGTFAGSMWARIVSLIVTVLAMVGTIAFITVYPFWSV